MTTALHPLVEQAMALMDLKRIDEARALLARRLAEDPTDIVAWLRLARCHEEVRDYQEVLNATNEVLALNPEEYGAYLRRTYAFRRLGRPDESLAAAHEMLRLEPESWQSHVGLSEALGAWQPRWPEALEAAATGVRLGPDQIAAHYALWKAALMNGRVDLQRQAVAESLRIDPHDAWALDQRAKYAEVDAARPPLTGAGAKLPAAAEAFADALAAAPQAPQADRQRKHLDVAVFRMLRGTRWLALLCVVIAALAARVFPTGSDPTALPGPLATRLYGLALMGAVWGFGAWRRYRGLRAGVRMSLWSLVRRVGWARLVVGQSVWCTLIAVVVVLVPWSERTAPQVLFWVALVPTLLTMWFERAAMRS